MEYSIFVLLLEKYGHSGADALLANLHIQVPLIEVVFNPWCHQIKSSGPSTLPSNISSFVMSRQKVPLWKGWPETEFVGCVSPSGRESCLIYFQFMSYATRHYKMLPTPGHYHYVTSAHAPSKTFSKVLINTECVNEPVMRIPDFVYALGFQPSLYLCHRIKELQCSDNRSMQPGLCQIILCEILDFTERQRLDLFFSWSAHLIRRIGPP